VSSTLTGSAILYLKRLIESLRINRSYHVLNVSSIVLCPVYSSLACEGEKPVNP
jgi:hypothetical protein